MDRMGEQLLDVIGGPRTNPGKLDRSRTFGEVGAPQLRDDEPDPFSVCLSDLCLSLSLCMPMLCQPPLLLPSFLPSRHAYMSVRIFILQRSSQVPDYEGTVQLDDLPNLCLLLILTVYLHITHCGMAGRRAASVVCILPAAQRRGYLVDIGSAHRPWSSLGLGVSRRVLLHPSSI